MYSIYRSLMILSLVMVTGCVTRLNEPNKKIDGRFLIEDARYQKDRTMLLTDIAPVIDAYVKHPFPRCNIEEMEVVSQKGRLKADLTQPLSERVYQLGGGQRCVW